MDFVVCIKRMPDLFIEVKASAEKSLPSLIYLKNKFPRVRAIQLALNIKKPYLDAHEIEYCSGLEFLRTFV